MDKACINAQNSVVFACSSMLGHLKAANQSLGTDIPVIPLGRQTHVFPSDMRQKIRELCAQLPDSIEYILFAMGWSPETWKGLTLSRTAVIPDFDDCVSILLANADDQVGDLKQKGHMYYRDSDGGQYSIRAILESAQKEYGMEPGTTVFGSWFADYVSLDIIDTGAYDCYAEGFVARAEEDAQLIRVPVDFVQGSNLVCEKLLSGQWDDQFVVLAPGEEAAAGRFRTQPNMLWEY